jgi:GNAT superfamily N-acetyltransferase
MTSRPPFTLRAAVPSDAAAIEGLLTELGHATAAAEISGRLIGIRAEGGEVLFATAGSEAVGVMCLARHTVLHGAGPVAYITALVTTASWRGKGVGRAFVDAAIAWAREQGCARISVTSAEHRDDAHAFYPRCGLPYSGRRFSATISPDAAR